MPEKKFNTIFDMRGSSIGSRTRILGDVTSEMLNEIDKMPGNQDFVVRDGKLIPLSEATPEEKKRFFDFYGE